MEQTQSPPSSPPLEGYDTAGEEVGASSGEETTVEIRQKWRKTPKKPTKRSPRQPVRQSTRIAKGRFTPARPGQRGGSDSDIGSAADLISVESLVWDAHAQPLNSTIGTRRWSVEPQYGVPVGLEGGGERLSPHQEGRESAASGWVEQLPDTMAELNRVRDGVERALIEVEDDILPFGGKNLTTERLDDLVAKAGCLKKVLQDGHLYLTANDAEEYQANLMAAVTGNRRSLSAFIVELEEMMAAREETAAQATGRAANTDEARLNARQVVVRTRVAVLQNQVKSLLQDGRVFCTTTASTDEELYERAEKHKLLGGRLLTALEEC